MKCTHETCGILFPQFLCHDPKDATGCVRPNGHNGPHKFRCKDGEIWGWETDWECDCDHCMKNDGDFCVLYWKENSLNKE